MTDAPYRPENEGPLATPEEIAAETHRGPVLIAVQAPFATPEKLERARELVRTLAVAHTNAALYPTTHPLGRPVARRLRRRRCARSAAFGFDEVTINIYKGTLFVENQVFPEESVTYRKLIEELLARGISAVTFTSTADRRGGRRARRAARRRRASPTSRPRAPSSRPASVTSTSPSPRPPRSRTPATRSATARCARGPARATTPASARCATSRRRPSSAASMEVGPLQRVVESMLDNLLQDPAAVLGLTAIKGHDDYTLNHSINVCILSLSLGSALGLDRRRAALARARRAALRHRQGAHPRGDPRARPAR